MRAEIIETGIPKLKAARIIINAPVEKVFAIVTNPNMHPVIDGSGMVKGSTVGPEKLILGSKFGMKMKIKVRYRILNTVVEYKENELIAWNHIMRNRWRYEFRAIDSTTTEVTEYLDTRRSPFTLWFHFVRVYEWSPIAMAKTLVNLKEIAEK